MVHDNGQAGVGCSGKRNSSRIYKNIVYRNMGGGIGIADDATPTVEANICFNNLLLIYFGTVAQEREGFIQQVAYVNCRVDDRSWPSIAEKIRYDPVQSIRFTENDLHELCL